ncbi:MAG: efflux RND transporter periplasmic adaptor subunit [Bryobacteraceae bacterium]
MIREDISSDLVLAAEFRPYQETNLHAKVAGYLREIRVDVGDRVQQGQLIAVLEIPELNEDLARAVADKRRTEAEVSRVRGELKRVELAHKLAHLSYTRLQKVLESRPNLVAQQEIDEAMSRAQVAEAQVATARAALMAAEQAVQVAAANEEKMRRILAYSQIVAPFTGMVTKRYVDNGAMVPAGISSSQAMPIVRLSQINRLRLVLPIPESIVPRVRVGSKVEVRVRSLGQTFHGRVSRLAGKVIPSTRTMETEIDVPNPELVMLPGMYADAVLNLEAKEAALSVPIQAVSGDEDSRTVLVVGQDGRVEERQVRLGIETPSKYEVLSGLKENEQVILGSRGSVKVGERVEPVIVKLAELKKDL